MKHPNGYFRVKACRCCSTDFQPEAPSNLYCSDACKVLGNRNAYYMRTYGLPVMQYEALLVEQGGRCAICREEGFLMKKHHRAKLMVDHCHVTGTVRGLLCHNCNRALGLLQEDATLLKVAAAYVSRHLEGATTIPKGSTPEAFAGGSAEPLKTEGEDIVWTRRRRRAVQKDG